jgi:hypothetical protein
MMAVTELHAKSVALRRRAEYVLHKFGANFSLSWTSVSRSSRSNDELAGAIGALVLCAVLLLVSLGISSVKGRGPSEGRPTTTEREAVSNILYGRQR